MGTIQAKTLKAAVRCMGKDASRPTLMHVHLDECGDVVATDALRMFVEHGAWDGPTIDVPADEARALAKEKGAVEVSGEAIKYPNYRNVMGVEPKVVALIWRDELLAIAREIIKENRESTIVFDAFNGDLFFGGRCFKKVCDGENAAIGLNPKFVRDAMLSLEDSGDKAVQICIGTPNKPAVFKSGNREVLVMPIRFDSKSKPKKGFKQAPKSPEPKADGKPIDLKGEVVCITGTLPTMTRGEAFTRLKLADATPCERFTSKVTLFVVAANAGKSKKEKAEKAIADGQAVRIVNGSEFVAALNEQGKTKREQEENMEKKTTAKPKATTKPKTAAKPKAATKPKAPAKPKATAPRRKPTPKKDDALEAALKELAELRAMVESITAEKSAPVQEQATKVSLDTILKEAQLWCADKPNVSAYRKNSQPSTPVRIAGETKPYEDELRDKGFRWSRKGFWYMGERELAAR